MAALSKVDIGTLLRLFNRGGYVLDFSTNEFDVFTLASVGVALCEHYKQSKGKSLAAYINEASDADCQKLLKDLFDYYEENYEGEFTPHEYSFLDGRRTYDANYAELYKRCKSIMDRTFGKSIPLAGEAENLKKSFSSDYLNAQIDLMLKMQSENPTEAIGKAKELIESCCKTILEDNNVQWDKNWDVGKLTGETMKLLKLMPDNIPETVAAASEMKALLGNLRAIATNMAALRNPYGSGHGKSASYKGLEERHAKLAVGSSITFVTFLLETHEKSDKT